MQSLMLKLMEQHSPHLELEQGAAAALHAALPGRQTGSSPAAAPVQNMRRRAQKSTVAEAYLAWLASCPDIDTSSLAEMAAGVRNHFNTLPTRYCLDVSLDSLDPLSHKASPTPGTPVH